MYRLSDVVGFHFGFFFNDTATTEIYTLSLHDALPICHPFPCAIWRSTETIWWRERTRSEEHTSELQSLRQLVCRLLLEKKKTHRKDRLADINKRRQSRRIRGKQYR